MGASPYCNGASAPQRPGGRGGPNSPDPLAPSTARRLLPSAPMRSIILGVATAAAMASPAYAHIALNSPPPRVTDLKEGPCGKAGSVRGSNVTVFEPGATITVTWQETVAHPGHYRIA